MELLLRGTHLDVTPELHSYAEEKIGGLDKYSSDVIRIELELSFDASGREHNAFGADAVVTLPGPDLRAEEHGREIHEAIDLLQEKLKAQLIKHKSRELGKRRKPRPQSPTL